MEALCHVWQDMLIDCLLKTRFKSADSPVSRRRSRTTSHLDSSGISNAAAALFLERTTPRMFIKSKQESQHPGDVRTCDF
ncbi:hypothetical protein J6590_064297 [Homalodisca vitripennis]|nr:hypothetical protein J6590_064297 [Homalodisca vitripennis]